MAREMSGEVSKHQWTMHLLTLVSGLQRGPSTDVKLMLLWRGLSHSAAVRLGRVVVMVIWYIPETFRIIVFVLCAFYFSVSNRE